ncbi:methyltransferase domain-containing protein [Geobacter sp.]|uniref:methyltransferase domain-containing protein n=1 Tax=Geobacter sp. TaxID=46610 RepID=UPI002632CA67|nr:methyltransferase domain-containing protein [Geobacter sp.]
MYIALKRWWIRLYASYVAFRHRSMLAVIRHVVADKYLRGEGIEIGALHNPLIVPKHARVRYVDKWPTSYLKEHYPELRTRKLVPVDIVADGETLDTVCDASLDFVIANHFIEHCKNSLKTLEQMFRVLRPGGILFVSLPDKRFTFDVNRQTTQIDHLLKDYADGPEWSMREHAEEWVTKVLEVKDSAEAERQVKQLSEAFDDTTMHFHAWTQDEILEIILALKRQLRLNFETELFFRNGDFEVIFVLRKTA